MQRKNVRKQLGVISCGLWAVGYFAVSDCSGVTHESNLQVSSHLISKSRSKILEREVFVLLFELLKSLTETRGLNSRNKCL